MTLMVDEPIVSLPGNNSEKVNQTTTDVVRRNEKSPSNKRKKRATVHFAEDDSITAPPPPLTEEDFNSIWYAKKDLECVMIENLMILAGIDNDCSLGLKDASNQQARKVIESVLIEQERQRCDGTFDEENIASASLEFSIKPSMSAYSRAIKLEKEVELYQCEVKKTKKKSRSFIARTKRSILKRFSV